MVRKLKILVGLLLLSSMTFSQIATNKKVHCFPDSIAKQIAIDLVRGDSAKIELTKTIILVNQLEEKNLTNERLVNTYVSKVANFSSQIDLYRQKEVKYTQIVTGLEKDVKKERSKNKIIKIAAGVFAVLAVIGFASN